MAPYKLNQDDMKIVNQMAGQLNATRGNVINPQPEKKSGNPLLDFILPTLGGVVGGIGGTLLAPVAGTAAGGAAGSAAGKWLSNVIQGKDDKGEGVLSEGLFGALPGAGKLLKGGVNLVRGAKAAGDVAEGAGLASRVGSKIENYGNKLMASQANIEPRRAAKMLNEPLSDIFGRLQQKTGMSNMDDLLDVGKSVTGEGGTVPHFVNKSVEPLNVGIADLRNVTERSLIDRGIPKKKAGDILENVKNQTVKAYGGSAGSLSDVVGGKQALDASRFFDELASTNKASYATSLTKDVSVKQAGQVYGDIADTIKQRIYSAKGAVENFTAPGGGKEQIVKDFRAAAAQAGGKKGEAYTKLADDFEKNVNDIPGARSFQKDFVTLGKVAKEGDISQYGTTAKITGEGTGLRKFGSPMQLLGAAVDKISAPLGGKAANFGRKLQGAEGAVAGAEPAATGFTKGNLIKGLLQQGVPRAVLSPMLNGQPASAMSEDVDPDIANMLQTGEGGAPVTDEATAQQAMEAAGVDANGTSKDQIDSQIIQAAMNGDKEGMSMLIGLSQYLYPDGADTKLSAGAQKSLQSTDSAGLAVQQLEGLLQKNGGQSNGVLANIFGGIQSAAGDVGLNDDARIYNQTAQSLVTALAKSIGGDSGTLSDQDVSRAQNMIPKLTDSTKVQQQKLQNIKERLAGARQSAITYGTGGSSDLASVMGGA